MSLFIGLFVWSLEELRRHVIFHDLFRADNFLGRPVFPTYPGRPGLIHPDFMTEHLFCAIGRNGPQDLGSGSWSRYSSVFRISDVQAQLEGIFRVYRHGLLPRVPGIMA